MTTPYRGFTELPTGVVPDVPYRVNLALREVDADIEAVSVRSEEAIEVAKVTQSSVAALRTEAEEALTAANGVSGLAAEAKTDADNALALAQASVAPADNAVAGFIRSTITAARAALREMFEEVETPQKYAGAATPTAAHITQAMTAAVTSKRTVRLDALTYAGSITIPDGVTVLGAGIGRTVITGRVAIGSNVILRDVTFESGIASYFSNGADGSLIERVHFKGGSGAANLYLNDTRATNHTFRQCLFTDNVNGGNGIQIVDKGTELKHYENIVFERCTFRNNTRMNFECIQRSDVGNPVVLGYRSIDLIRCIFKPTTVTINVSYDSGLLDGSATDRSSGYSTVEGCKIEGGSYGLELAGAIRMRVEDNDIEGQTSTLLSCSQVGANYAGHIFRNNRFRGTVVANDVTFSGNDSIIQGNYVKTPGRFRFVSSGNNNVLDNYIDCSGATAISLESSFHNHFAGNKVLGGTNQSVLVIYATSDNNSFTGNYMYQPNVGFDLRDGKLVYRSGNVLKRGGAAPVTDDNAETIAVLPAASSTLRGKTFMVRGAAGAADVLHICMKSAADTYSWKPVMTG